MSFQSSFYNGMNRGGIVAAALGDLQVLQGLPQGLLQGLQGLYLCSHGIEERWEDGGRGLPEENLEVEWYMIYVHYKIDQFCRSNYQCLLMSDEESLAGIASKYTTNF